MRDIKAFRKALHAKKYDNETMMSVFGEACKKRNDGEFFKECFLAGCDVNEVLFY